MTARAKQSVVQDLSDLEYIDLEARNPPVALYLAGIVVVLNVCATVLSLMD